MSEADIFCGIAEHPRIPAEFTRMALECAARLSGWSWLEMAQFCKADWLRNLSVPGTAPEMNLQSK